MKVFTNIVLTLVLLTATVGFSVDSHYCMGHLMDQKVFGQADKCGDKGPVPMGCCDNTTSFYQIDDEISLQVRLEIETPNPPLLYIVPFSTELSAPIRDQDKILALLNRPPPVPGPDMHIRIQTFLL